MRVRDRVVALSQSEMAILMALVRAAVSRCPAASWRRGYRVGEWPRGSARTVNLHVCLMLRKLGDDMDQRRIIATIPSVGYAIEI
ncbi:MAG TPA: helix-turn-helix domain-containing protein [Gemmatimonadaceae bacterium]|nr:helix-turn-helix domain-containing protein [Gemmatimonadaceae bacterium]